jgi:fatty-acyl-CoA synthase
MTEDGWFKTGDLMIEREDGYFSWVGRIKDMLRVGGFNVYSAEVEKVLKQHPEIQEAVVIGVPDKRLEEVAVGWVCLHEGAKIDTEEVIEFAKEHLSSYAVPRYIRFYKEGELALSATAKNSKT